jgi:DNA-binding LacI/PurR family transcriptional regulator
MATLLDIAERAGVSKDTAARVLRGEHKGVRADAAHRARRVRRIAREMGYRPNAAARAVARGRFGGISLLKSQGGHSPIPPDLIKGIQNALAPLDWHLTLDRLPESRATDPQYMPKVLREQFADGLLVYYPDRIPEGMVGLIRDYRIPAIWVNSKLDADCAHPDDLAAGRRATEHLLALGHLRIAYADYSYDVREIVERAHYSAVDRQTGYDIAMRAAGLAPCAWRAERHVNRPFRKHDAADRLRAGGRPTAIVCHSLGEAIPICLAAMALGIGVPGELSVTAIGGAGDGLVADFTALTLPEAALGETAVRMLEEKIANPAAALAPRAIGFAFHQGETTAPLRT